MRWLVLLPMALTYAWVLRRTHRLPPCERGQDPWVNVGGGVYWLLFAVFLAAWLRLPITLTSAFVGTMREDLKQQITKLGLDYRMMTQFTSFVAVEDKVMTEGGVPRRVEVPVEMPEGMSYEGLPPAYKGPKPGKTAVPVGEPSDGYFVSNLAVTGPFAQTRGPSDSITAWPCGTGLRQTEQGRAGVGDEGFVVTTIIISRANRVGDGKV